MSGSEDEPVVDHEVDMALAEILAKAKKEKISPRLRDLASQLEAALEQARHQHRDENSGDTNR